MTSAITTEVLQDVSSEEKPDIPKEDEDTPADVKALFNEAFDVMNWIFTIVGLGDLYKAGSVFTIRQKLLYAAGLTNLIICMTGQLITVMLFFIRDDDALLVTFEVLPCFFLCIFSVTKSLLLIIKKKHISSLVTELREMWPATKIESINHIVRENIISAKKYYKFYIFATINVGNAYNAAPLLTIFYNVAWTRIYGYSNKWNENLYHPYGVWYPHDTFGSLWIYIPTFLSQCHAGIFVSGLVAAIDCFFCLLLAHVTMHFQLLHRQIRNLYMAHDDVPLEEAVKNVKEEIRDVVVYHNKLYDLAHRIEGVFTSVLFINLVIISVVICIQIFCLTMAPLDRLFKYTVFFVSSVTEITLICHYGNRMTEESIAVRDAAYDCGWVDGGLAVRSAVLMLQCRTEKPAEISALGFTTASLSTLCSILRASWSYFTLLHNVYEEEEVE